MLNLSKVDYDSVFAKEVREMRGKSAYGARNLATICLTNDHKVTKESIPPGKKGVTPIHSEANAWGTLKSSTQFTRTMRIKWVYTERYPCGFNPGMRNCYGLLEGVLKDWGDAGLDTPVYFTYEYPDTSHMFLTMAMCYKGYSIYQTKNEEEKHIIQAATPGLIQIGQYLHENDLNPFVKQKEVTEIATSLYGCYRDEAFSALKGFK